ncbi:MAG: glycosyltransferase [Pseudonocardiaceae bacterium]
MPIEVELGDPLSSLAMRCAELKDRGVGTALVLVRLHTHPLGVIVLDTEMGRSCRACTQVVRSALGEVVDAHLVMDGLTPAEPLAAKGCPALTPPPCLHRRTATLEQAPPVSVIVATRNRPDSLTACLGSLLRLEYPHYEIIIVDNDPSDEITADLVRTRFGSYPQIRYVREPMRGLAAAHNRGVAVAQGRILAFTDDDVIADSQWLAALAEGFAIADGVGCVTGLILPAALETPAQLFVELHGAFGKGFTPRLMDRGGNRPADPLFPFTAGRLGSGANMAFDAALLRELGGFDPATGAGTVARGGDDLSAFFRVIARGRRLCYQPDALIWHYHRRELAGVRTQAYGYGVGLGAYLTSALVHEPAMWPALLYRLPGGLAYAFSRSSQRHVTRYADWPTEYAALPKELARLERRGLLRSPVAYTVSRWRTRGAPRRTAALLASPIRANHVEAARG